MAQNLIAATSSLPQVLVAQQLASSATTQYTCPAATSAKISSASITNTSASPVTVSISIVKSGGSAGASNRVLSAYSLAAGDSTVLNELKDVFLGPGDFISTQAGTASAVALVISGVIFS